MDLWFPFPLMLFTDETATANGHVEEISTTTRHRISELAVNSQNKYAAWQWLYLMTLDVVWWQSAAADEFG